jgi:hypothetical protein
MRQLWAPILCQKAMICSGFAAAAPNRGVADTRGSPPFVAARALLAKSAWADAGPYPGFVGGGQCHKCALGETVLNVPATD